MIRKILYIILFISLTAGVLWLNIYPGTLRLDWQGHVFETSITFFSIAFLFFLFLLHLLGKVWRYLEKLPMRISRRSQKRHREIGLLNLGEAITAQHLEKRSLAKEKAYGVQRFLNTPLQHHLLFEIALAENNVQRAKEQIQEMQRFPEMKMLVLVDLIRLCQHQDETAQMHTHLIELERLDPHAPYVLKNLLKTSIQLSRYDKALELVQRLYKDNLLEKEDLKRTQAHLLYAQSHKEEQDIQQRITILKQVHSLAPDFVPATLEYAKILHVQNKERLARKVLETTWQLAPRKDISALYLTITDEAKSVAIERLSHLTPKHPLSSLLQAQDAVEKKEWRKARAHLKKLEDMNALTPEAYELLATIELKENSDLEQYQHWMHKALEHQTVSRWSCAICHHTEPSWQILCPQCKQISIYTRAESNC